MPSDHAVAMVNRAPSRIGATFITAWITTWKIQSWFKTQAREDDPELGAIDWRRVQLIHRQRHRCLILTGEPTGRHGLLEMLVAWRGVADFVQQLAVHQKRDLERAGDSKAILPQRKIDAEFQIFR